MNNFNKNFIVKILLEACQLELLEQFGPRKFHTKINEIYILILLIYNYSTINNKQKHVKVINFICASFWVEYVPIFPIHILRKTETNYQQQFFELC